MLKENDLLPKDWDKFPTDKYRFQFRLRGLYWGEVRGRNRGPLGEELTLNTKKDGYQCLLEIAEKALEGKKKHDSLNDHTFDGKIDIEAMDMYWLIESVICDLDGKPTSERVLEIANNLKDWSSKRLAEPTKEGSPCSDDTMAVIAFAFEKCDWNVLEDPDDESVFDERHY